MLYSKFSLQKAIWYIAEYLVFKSLQYSNVCILINHSFWMLKGDESCNHFLFRFAYSSPNKRIFGFFSLPVLEYSLCNHLLFAFSYFFCFPFLISNISCFYLFTCFSLTSAVFYSPLPSTHQLSDPLQFSGNHIVVQSVQQWPLSK